MWSKNPQKYKTEHKRPLMAHWVKTMILSKFRDQFNRCDVNMRGQMKGSPMRVRASGTLSRITIDKCICLFREKLD